MTENENGRLNELETILKAIQLAQKATRQSYSRHSIIEQQNTQLVCFAVVISIFFPSLWHLLPVTIAFLLGCIVTYRSLRTKPM